MLNKIKSFLKKELLFLKSVNLVLSVSYLQSLALIVSVIIQGLMPAITIKLSAYIVDVVTQYQGTSSSTYLLVLCVLWVFSLFFYSLITPISMFLQGNISEKAVHSIHKNIMKKTSSISGLFLFESSEFQDIIAIIKSQAHNKPINLIVTCVGLIRDGVLMFSCLLLLSSIIPWIGLVCFLGAYVNFKIVATIQEKTWKETLGRSPNSRKMNYIFSLFVSSSYVKEMKIYPTMQSFLFRQYDCLFKKIYTSMYRLRLKQIYWPIFPLVITMAGNFFAFLSIIHLILEGSIGSGSIILFLQSLSQLYLGVQMFGEQSGWVKGHLIFFKNYFSLILVSDQKVYEPSTVAKY